MLAAVTVVQQPHFSSLYCVCSLQVRSALRVHVEIQVRTVSFVFCNYYRWISKRKLLFLCVATLDVYYDVYLSCPYLARLSVESLTYL